ncbi:MAG: ATP-binding protein [Pseudonocardiaceae bacterium]
MDPLFFVPRNWLDDAVNRWLASNTASRVMVLSGSPGTGKSRFLHAWSRACSTPVTRATLAAAIVRDPHSPRIDGFEWSGLRDALLSNVPDSVEPRSMAGLPELLVNQYIGHISGGEVSAIRANVVNLALNLDFVGDFRENVAPLLRQLPDGEPLVVVIDGLDEALRDDAEKFLSLVAAMAEAIERTAERDRGLGRLRLLLATQPEIPLDVNAFGSRVPPVLVDLSEPPDSDERNLEAYVRLLLDPLPEGDRDRLASLIANRAGGV